jgi:subtilisin family serine protease
MKPLGGLIRWALLTALAIAGIARGGEFVAGAPEEFLNPQVLTVKFKDGPRIRLRNGAPRDVRAAPAALQNARARAVLRDIAARGAKWHRTHELADESFLERLTEGKRGLADLNHYFRLVLPPDVDIQAVGRALAELDEVEFVARVPILVPPPSVPDHANPANPSGVWQRYLDAAPAGIDARYAWSNGLTGVGHKICDVEYGWNSTHADLPSVLLLGGPPIPTGYDEHGTAVLGQMAGRHNTNGVRGIAHGAAFRFVSP